MSSTGGWSTPSGCRRISTPRRTGLRPLAVETVAGTIYVSLDEAPDFSPFRDVLGPMLAPHRLERGKLAFETKLVERGNWKLVMENARECYHCAVRHPELSTTFPVRAHRNYEADGDARVLAFNDRVASLGFPVGSAAGRLVAGGALSAQRGHGFADAGRAAGGEAPALRCRPRSRLAALGARSALLRPCGRRPRVLLQRQSGRSGGDDRDRQMAGA